MKKSLLTSLISAAALSACTLAPVYERPQVSTTDIPAVQPAEQPAADLGWREYFADPRLRALIQAALDNNADLRMAALNAEAARVQYGISTAEYFPVIAGTGDMTRTRTSALTNPMTGSMVLEQYTAGLGFANWEIDLFGKVRSMNNAAMHQYFSARHNRDAAHISLVAGVAKAYFAQRTAEETMALTGAILKARTESYRLTELSYRAGIISTIDLNLAKTQIESARSSYADAQNARDNALNALAVLTGGRLPENLPAGLPLDKQYFNDTLPVGMPSEMLNRRPDIRAAEASLQAANAQIGAARAAFFPSISLTGSIGSASLDLDDLFSGPARTWAFVPRITLPIFTFGRNKGNLDLAHIRTESSVANYEKTVQEAFRETADVLSAHEKLNVQIDAHQKIAAATGEVLDLTEMRYRQGVSSALELLDAQRNSDSASINLIQTRLAALNNRVDIYKTFGGGLWETRAQKIAAEKAAEKRKAAADTQQAADKTAQ